MEQYDYYAQYIAALQELRDELEKMAAKMKEVSNSINLIVNNLNENTNREDI